MSQHCCLMWVQHFHSLQSCHGGRDVRARSPLYRATIISLSSLAAPSYPQRPSWLSPRMLAGSIRAQIMRTHPVLVTAAASARCYTSSLHVHGNYVQVYAHRLICQIGVWRQGRPCRLHTILHCQAHSKTLHTMSPSMLELHYTLVRLFCTGKRFVNTCYGARVQSS